MKKITKILPFLLAIAMSGLGQSTPREKNDSVCALVKRYMNEKATDSLYALTGERFRQQIAPDLFKNITNNNLFPLGAIKETGFIKNVGNISVYKAVFSSATLSLIIGLDSLGKLETFAFQPYKDESARKTGPILTNNPLSTAQDKKVDSVALAYMHQLAPVGLSIGILRDGKTATIRTLSNHTSGIPPMPGNFQQTAANNKDPYAGYSTSDLYSFLHGLKLKREPGSAFEYSNTAVGLLGTARMPSLFRMVVPGSGWAGSFSAPGTMISCSITAAPVATGAI